MGRESRIGKTNEERGRDKGVGVWKDEGSDVWKLRATGGGKKINHFKGSIVAEQPIDLATGVDLEKNDILNTSDPNEIRFDFTVQNIWEDGIDFRLPEGAAATLSLGADNSGANDVIADNTNNQGSAQLLKVGAQQWEVNALPLDLSGWDM